MKRSAIQRKTELKRTPFVSKPKPMRAVGKATKANVAANRISKARVESEGLEFCWLCGSTFNLQRSHSLKRRRLPELTHVAILDGECHAWLEYKLDPITRQRVNDLLIEMRFDEGHERFAQMCLLLNDSQRRTLETMLIQRRRIAA